MEHIGAISQGEWNSSNEMWSEEAEFMAQLLGTCSLPAEVQGDANFLSSSAFWPPHDDEWNGNIAGVDQTAMHSSGETNNSSVHSFSRGISSHESGGGSIHFPSSGHESCYPSVCHQVFLTNNELMMMDYCVMEDKDSSSDDMGGDEFLNQDVSNDSRDHQSNSNVYEDVVGGKSLELIGTGPAMAVPEAPEEERVISSPSEFKKRSRIPGEAQVRNKRSMKLKFDGSDEDKNNNNNNNNNNAVFHRQNSSGSCLEDDGSNASHELNGLSSSSGSKGSRALSLERKTRANRGSATDPQSLYARKRRERINERLRILQKLVPSGTKVDISTMLEEAVQYVKFLQLQIKLLSSDDLWMYAPIAYNGMDIGLDLKISAPKPQS